MYPIARTRVRCADVVVRATTRDEHSDFVQRESVRARAGHVSFLQCPSWADVKHGWDSRYFGVFDGGEQVCGALVLCRKVPRSERFFAYVPEGPVVDWARPDTAGQIAMLVRELQDAGAFAVRIGPPLAHRRWSAATLKRASGPGRRLSDVPPDQVDPLSADVADMLSHAGWSRCDDLRGSAQPRHVFTKSLDAADDRSAWDSLSQGWRRNVRRARDARVSVTEGGLEDIPAFYDVVRETERRQGFYLGRSQQYFERQFRVLNGESPGRMRLYLATHRGTVLAAHTLVTLGPRAWYLNGGSATSRRQVGSGHLLQWRMINDSAARQVTTYDMRGVPTVLDPSDPSFGLLQWKLGTGGDLVEMLGEWEIGLPGVTNRALHYGFRRYLGNSST